MHEEETPVHDPFDYFFGEAYIAEVIRPLKSGKEATVHLCRAHPKTGRDLVALKTYREHRSFRNDAVYNAGRLVLDERAARAIKKGTRFGRRAADGIWVGHEVEALARLHRAGADVPEPIATDGASILMEYVGDDARPAPQLRHVRPEPEHARALFDRVMANVEAMLLENLIHGDLSPFNILVWGDEVRIIDFPQWIDPRFNPYAEELLGRDVANVCRYFARFGVEADEAEITNDLWVRFQFATL